MVTLLLHGILDTYSDKCAYKEFPCEDGLRVADIISGLGIPPGVVGVVLVNRELSDKDVLLRENDRVDLYPVFGGG